MKIKSFVGLLIVLMVAGCAPMDTPVSKELKQQIEHDENNAMLHAGLAEEYHRQFVQEKSLSALLAAKDSITKAETLEPNNLQIKRLSYAIIKDNALVFRDSEMIDELYRRFPDLKRAGIKVFPPSFIKAISYGRDAGEKETVQLLTQAMREEPDFVGSYALLAEYYNYKEHYDLAIDTAKRAIVKAPNYPDLYATLASAYYFKIAELEDADECGVGNVALNKSVLDAAAQAIRLDHEKFAEPMNIVMMQSYERLGQRELVLFLAEKVHKSDDTDRPYAETLQINGRLKESMALLEQQTDSESSQTKAMGYFMQQDWKHSVGAFEEYFESAEELRYADYVYYLSALRMDGQTSKLEKTLATLRTMTFKRPWENTLIKFYLGEISKEELLQAAQNRCSTTEALFVLGMDALARKNVEEAKGFFRELKAQKIYSYYEYAVATYYLENGLKG